MMKIANPTEEAWSAEMLAAQQGSSEAYSRLLTSLLEPLRRFFKKRLHDPQMIEDLVQETLLSVHKARHTYQSSQPFAPWLFSIARYRLIDHLRVAGRTFYKNKSIEVVEDLSELSTEFHLSHDERNQKSEINEELQEALAAIPARQRQAVLLLKQEDRSVKEAAMEMGVSESALKVLAHRGYVALRALLRGSKNI
jgi:RNA polymerase sigma-70 factor, ECF subfamily